MKLKITIQSENTIIPVSIQFKHMQAKTYAEMMGMVRKYEYRQKLGYIKQFIPFNLRKVTK